MNSSPKPLAPSTLAKYKWLATPSGRAKHEKWKQSSKGRAVIAKTQRKYQAKLDVKMAKRLRDRLRMAVKNGQRAGSAVRDLGCSIEDFKLHIERQFEPGMTWENWGRHGWHIDHIKPLVSFDLTDRKQFLEACNYTNLRPLWCGENWSKGGKEKIG